MSTQEGLNHKRSIQDTPADLTKMQLVRQRLSALQGELGGEAEMGEIMRHLDALQDIFSDTKKLTIPFSSVQQSDLEKMGLERKVFRLDRAALEARIEKSDIEVKYIDALCLQISRIRRSTSKRSGAGARMVLDAILLTIADISFDAKEKLPVAIFPYMRIASGDGVLVKNARDGFEVYLIGNVDYGICTYQYEEYRVVVLGSSLDHLMIYTRNPIMLVEAKVEMLIDYLPQATSQAVALSEVTGTKTVRYCLSDGDAWMFLVYSRDDEGNRISYEGPVLTIDKRNLRSLVELLYHWLRADGDIKSDPLFEF
ncbi:uncharacterized protein EI90DRAFT_3044134 [Cantharellus anzutake]|uniref:uncharacterized protein n=1 Tax=Cantharellus anzutake TaxID=1750568 RepID=UPI001903CB9D|nr:uncharacterized protein EI90DRAFT_3044134 [Cantharellus anzutake]KAF8336918.1 hypothetical protein EI90DRAFT_3044134 [Cantharellus anzutake]